MMSLAATSPTRIKQAFETMQHRLSNIKKNTERSIERAASVAFTGGTSLLMGYANERWGAPPAADPSGYKELTVMKVPVDMLAGGVGLAGVFLGAFGKYDHFGLSVSNGAAAAFLYRFGAEFARKNPAAAGTAPAATTTQGAFGPAQSQWQGRPRHVAYAAP
jgi:hypothetical protein